MDSLKIEVVATVEFNNKKQEVYCETELNMNQEQFDELSDEEILPLVEKYVDWELYCGISELKVISVSVEDSYEVDPNTGFPFE